MSIYAWRRKYQKYGMIGLMAGMIGLMAKKNSIPRQPLPEIDAPLQSDELEALRTQIRELQLEMDVLKETIEVFRQHRRTRQRKSPAGRFHPAGHSRPFHQRCRRTDLSRQAGPPVSQRAIPNSV